MVIVGYQKNSFKAEDGKEISGYNLYLGRKLNRDTDAGVGYVERVFLSDNKLANIGYFPTVGEEVEVLYEMRFGKPRVASIRPM